MQDAISANTAVKFAGGVSAKDARALSNDLRCDAAFITEQEKLNFAAFIKGQTKRALSISIVPGLMENSSRMSDADYAALLSEMRARYAVHHSKLREGAQEAAERPGDEPEADPPQDNGEPMPWL
ncbi:hypothetical protein [Aliiroseovarius sp.]|uniref:hypothetical protein n=1 Tax=Aliiroseovarius sp. TaxID=1872442 RepID=UPI003BAC9685